MPLEELLEGLVRMCGAGAARQQIGNFPLHRFQFPELEFRIADDEDLAGFGVFVDEISHLGGLARGSLLEGLFAFEHDSEHVAGVLGEPERLGSTPPLPASDDFESWVRWPRYQLKMHEPSNSTKGENAGGIPNGG